MKPVAAFLSLMLSLSPVVAHAEARPGPPVRPALPMAEADCANAERRRALIGDPEAVIEQASAYGLALNGYSDRLMEWRDGRLRATGRWTEADGMRLRQALLENPRFMEEAAAGIGLAMDVLTPLQRFADESRSDEDKCRDLIETQSLFERITASVERQWAMIDEVYAAEAERLGISLD